MGFNCLINSVENGEMERNMEEFRKMQEQVSQLTEDKSSLTVLMNE